MSDRSPRRNTGGRRRTAGHRKIPSRYGRRPATGGAPHPRRTHVRTPARTRSPRPALRPEVGRLLHRGETATLRITDQLSVGYYPLTIFLLAVLLLLGLWSFLGRTRLGRMMRATSDDAEVARLMGVDSRRIYGIATAIAFGTVALAGVLNGIGTSFSPVAGSALLIFAFEAVIIGGLGNLWGTLLGGVLLGVAQNVGAMISPAQQILAGHIVFLVVLAFRPQGLLGKRVPV